MKKFVVTFKYNTYYDVMIDATDVDAAWDLAQDLTDDEIMVNGMVDEEFEDIINVEEIEPEDDE